MHLSNRALWIAIVALFGCRSLADNLIPDQIPGAPHEPPVIWRAADTPELIASLPHDITAMLEQQNRARGLAVARGKSRQPDDPCGGISFAPVQSEHYLPNDTLEDLAKTSREIYSGEIVGTRPGFFRGALVTMLAINATRLKQNGGPPETILVPYPQATIQVNGTSYCARVNGPAMVPSVHDRVIVFSYEPAAGSNGTIITADAERELVLSGKDGIQVPKALRLSHETVGTADFNRIRDQVAAAVRSAAESRSHAQ